MGIVATPEFGLALLCASYFVVLLGVIRFLLAWSRRPSVTEQREREASFLRGELFAAGARLVRLERAA